MALVDESREEGGRNSEQTMAAMERFIAASVEEFQTAF